MGHGESRPLKTASDGEDRSATGSATLADLTTYMGKCWLLAADTAAFSPSRWFPLCERTISRAPEACRTRPCFTLAPARPMPASERKKDARLLALPTLVLPPGLTLTTYGKVATASFALAELEGKSSVLVGGVHVDLACVEAAARDQDRPFICVIVQCRMDVEMTPTRYASAPYVRHPVRCPATNETDRRMYGEGCITGVRYGALIVGQAGDPAAGARLVEALRAKPALSKAEWHVGAACQSPAAAASATSASAAQPDSLRVLAVKGGGEEEGIAAKEVRSLQECAEWFGGIFDQPGRWRPLSLFLQRYEAIGQCLLSTS